MNFENIKKNYDKGFWTKQMVGNAIKKGIITANQYKEITGEDYTGTVSEKITADEIISILDGEEV